MGKDNRLEELHNKGQEDRSEGRYDPPHDLLDDILTWSESGVDKMNEENEAYSEGWNHTDEQKKGMCFLSTACTVTMRLPDDCEELEVLRQFRDTWLCRTALGREAIDEYYAIAPRIVKAINQSPSPTAEWGRVFRTIKKTVGFIEENEPERAFGVYRGMVRRLARAYLGGGVSSEH